LVHPHPHTSWCTPTHSHLAAPPPPHTHTGDASRDACSCDPTLWNFVSFAVGHLCVTCGGPRYSEHLKPNLDLDLLKLKNTLLPEAKL
jgi:hypothetical protein